MRGRCPGNEDEKEEGDILLKVNACGLLRSREGARVDGELIIDGFNFERLELFADAEAGRLFFLLFGNCGWAPIKLA